MRRETLDRPNLASRKKSVERFSLRSKSHSLVVRTDGKGHHGSAPLSRECEEVRDGEPLPPPLHRRALLTRENENKINELFVVLLFPCIGECTMNRGVHTGFFFASRNSIGNRLNFIFFLLLPPLSFFSLFAFISLLSSFFRSLSLCSLQ